MKRYIIRAIRTTEVAVQATIEAEDEESAREAAENEDIQDWSECIDSISTSNLHVTDIDEDTD